MKYLDQRISGVVFLAGFVLMALEIAAGRLLAPYFGDSVLVWGSLIGIVLFALAAGYYVGGWLADKQPLSHLLVIALLLSAVWVLLIPYVYTFFVSLSFESLHLHLLFSLSVLLIVPSVLLGAISPYAVKFCAHSLTKVGFVSGKLSAIHTVGSVVGTFAATFIFSTLFSQTATFILLALLLVLSSLLLVPNIRIAGSIVAVSTCVFLAPLVLSQLTTDSLADYSGDVTIASPYGDVRVNDANGIRYLSANGGDMSAMNISHPTARLPFWEYVDCMEAAFLFNANIQDALVIGNAGGSLSRRLAVNYSVSVDAVDINPVMIDVARRYFGLADVDGVSMHVADGRVFVRESQKKYDYVAVDAMHFDPILRYQVPFHLTTTEFFSSVHDVLRDDGVFSMNVYGQPNSSFVASVAETMKDSFESVYLFSCQSCCQVLVATKQPMLEKSALYDRYPPLNFIADECVADFDTSTGVVFTDERAPAYSFDQLLVS